MIALIILGRNGEAQGFSEAADQVMSAIEYYITKYSLEDEIKAGKVKFWVSGFSRDGSPFGKGAAIEAADDAVGKLRSEKDPAGTKYAALRLKSTKQTRKSIRLTWSKVSGANRYVLYGAKCGKTSKYQELATFDASVNAYTVKKIKTSFTRSGTVKKHVGIRFESSDTQIATVSSKGTITAKKKGSCKIYVFTQNGLCKIIKVRVK